ncbi:hypothetical protein GUJ93_ZPchr0014g46709 [Zizania palustris]|uniref:Uncharacterized protein n=1 Tax=Zizania palustris TaxID=103762 RepID=A0A8J5T9S5_ZIZPA|nr:hypothetical protein GUJ93_ZPchr0014g46709 [Zizania palustris]
MPRKLRRLPILKRGLCQECGALEVTEAKTFRKLAAKANSKAKALRPKAERATFKSNVGLMALRNAKFGTLGYTLSCSL